MTYPNTLRPIIHLIKPGVRQFHSQSPIVPKASDTNDATSAARSAPACPAQSSHSLYLKLIWKTPKDPQAMTTCLVGGFNNLYKY